MSEVINLEHQVGDVELGTALGLANTGRNALLALAIPNHEEWQLTILNRVRQTIQDAVEPYPTIPLGTSLGSKFLDLDKASLVTRWTEKTVDSAGKTSHQRRVKPVEGWELVQSLAGELGNLSANRRLSLVALVGESGLTPDGKIETATIAARIAIFSDMLQACERGDEITSNRRLAQAAAITNARSHVDDLLLLGVIEPTKPELNQRYRLNNDNTNTVEEVIIGNPRTKPEVIQLRRLILESMSEGNQSVASVHSYFERFREHPGSRFMDSLAPNSAMSRLHREFLRFERKGIFEKESEVGAAFKITARGILLVKKYEEILLAHTKLADVELKDRARKYHQDVVNGSDMSRWLAHSDYSTGKFKTKLKTEEKDALLSDILAEGPKTSVEITKKKWWACR